jgi:deaminated glutathione amidase
MTRPRRFTVAAVQMTSTADRDKNLAIVEYMARRAVDGGANLVALPENFAYLRPENERERYAESLEGELVGRLRGLATELACHLLAGSIPERIGKSRKIHNTSILIGPTGELLAVYRKIHLFDIRMRGKVVFEESKAVAAGDEPVVVETSLGTFGLSICYDLRFPELYRRLAGRGARVVTVPAAFTMETGKDHWEVLLRARAIENQVFVLAAAQCGAHPPTNVSYGNAMVVDPWGTVLARAGYRETVVVADLDFGEQERVRKTLPALTHRREDLFQF